MYHEVQTDRGTVLIVAGSDDIGANVPMSVRSRASTIVVLHSAGVHVAKNACGVVTGPSDRPPLGGAPSRNEALRAAFDAATGSGDARALLELAKEVSW